MTLDTPDTSFASLHCGTVAVKICGIMRPEDAIFASVRGATMIGLVFAESRRQLSVEAARTIVQALRSSGSATPVVGVFVNETPGRLREIYDATGIDVLQLSGDESPAVVAECARYAPVIKALRFPPGTGLQDAHRALEAFTSLGLGGRLRLLVDAYHPGSYGGTGSRTDWSLARLLAQREELILAGGLTPGNVAQATHEVEPWGVDVSSGVEREGRKDGQLIREFIEAARSSAAFPLS